MYHVLIMRALRGFLHHQGCKTAQLIQNLSGHKTALIQKFGLLSLRSFARSALNSNMVHGPSVHGTSQNLSAPKSASVQKIALALASQLREQRSPNFSHGT